MQKHGKRICALLLALCMLIGVLPASVLAAEDDATQIVSQQLFLGDDLTMHFYGTVSQAHLGDAVVNITVDGNPAAAYTVREMAAGENGYDFAVNLSAAQMTAEIVLTMTSGGETVLTKTYSVQNYAHYLLEGNYSKATKAMVKEMLNYGTKAQLYFGYKTNDLANRGYEMETAATVAEEAPAITVSGNVPGVTYYGASMVFESKVAVRYYFLVDGDAGAYTFAVDGKAYEPVSKNSGYYIEVTGINPQQVRAAMTVSVTDGENSLSFDYSPMHYITRMYHKETTNAALKDLLAAANGYFAAAEVFTGVAENRTGSLNLAYRDGANNQIQVNTNLPSDTPCKSFTAGDNGCNIDQSANQYQQVGWIGMDNADGTIVLTFHFNNAFEAGQTYVLPKGAVFGFTDESKYTLDKNYTFTFDGNSWSMTAKEDPITLTYRYGENNLIQFNTNLPATTPLVNFTAGQNGCNIDQSANRYQQVGWIGMDKVGDTIVLSFHFGNVFEVGQNYTLPAGAVFGFTDGSKYVLEQEINLYWTGSEWSTEAPAQDNTMSMTYRYGASNLIQVNTNLPATTPLVNFTAGQNGCDIDQSANRYQQVGWIGMDKVGDTIILAFHFGEEFKAGQTYVLPKGAVFGFTDGSKYTLDKNYTFTFDGTSWSMTTKEDPITLTYRYGENNLIQFNTNLPATTPLVDFTAGEHGCSLIQLGSQTVGWIGMDKVGDTIVLSFHFGKAFDLNQSYTLAAGSIFGFTDDSKYELNDAITLYWNGSAWTTQAPEPETPVDKLDAANFTGGKSFISFADVPVNAIDPANIEIYKGLGLNTSLLTEDYTGPRSADLCYGVSLETANGPAEGELSFQYRYGTSNLIQVNTNLPSDTPLKSFTAGQNGCIIDESANKHQWVGWIGMDKVGDTIILAFHFGEEFKAGQTYVLPAGAIFGFNDGNMYSLDKDYTFTWNGSTWYIDTLTLTPTYANGNTIQLKTNIPTGLTYGNFLLGNENQNLILETSEGAQAVGWFQFDEQSGAVYLTFHLNGYNKPGTQYVLKKGTSLKAGNGVFTTDRDYILTVTNEYLTSLENLDNAGLNVWVRNYTNKPDYFTDNMTTALKLYSDTIDGFYMADEVFETEALLNKANQTAISTDFNAMGTLRNWFNTNFAGKYFHVNHVGIRGYDHYGSNLTAYDVSAYRNFLGSYKASFNDQLASGSKATVGFDNYPFTHGQGYFDVVNFESGIETTYLLNCLIAAQEAGEDDLSVCVQTFEAQCLHLKDSVLNPAVTRDITSAAEVSLQLYTGMAMGVDVFEYFAYNSVQDFKGIMNPDGTKRIYDYVADANHALAFSDVLNTFVWNGIQTVNGSSNHHNGEAFDLVAGMVLTDENNGVLSSASATDDAIIGCFTKDDLNGYMVVNYNDPLAVTGSNSVTLNLAGCTRARVYSIVDGELTSQLVDMVDNAYTATLAPGGACFIIPA